VDVVQGREGDRVGWAQLIYYIPAGKQDDELSTALALFGRHCLGKSQLHSTSGNKKKKSRN
jgi:hypothetical protein